MSAEQPTIIYTLTDEAPLLATYAFLPIIRTFTEPAGINVQTRDISVAGRILAEFPDYLTEAQRVPDNLAELGRRHCQVNWWTYRPRVVRRFWWKALSQFTFRRRSCSPG
jgi:monomeric type NADP-dependent isocitrate dehydrogenase